MNARLAAVLIGLCASTGTLPAPADVTLTYALHDDGDGGSQIIAIAGSRLRFETVQEGERAIVLYDGRRHVLTMLDAEQKAYVEFGESSAAELERASAERQRASDARLGEELAKLPPEERAALEASLRGNVATEAVRVPRRIEQTGQHRSVAGIGCGIVNVWVDDEKQEAHCVASREALGLSEEEFATLTGALSALEQSSGQDGSVAAALGGVPIHSTERGEEDSELVTELRSVSRAAVPAERLRVPPDYQQQEAPPP
ncbi:MAG TPA: DUF4412 domain-containing protein [Plasticicumulans sp.]|uniref:DUF4412 domain-containing protein n=1 Tax=Plasticicumulans sp. TaxID=2307179 RepID=UPI000F9C36DB|nr:DUF4412 domain-containing protein [Plasticicumulans sp.]MBS0601708.1 DUF4412 domain-containing protein [Pseudomonadota bacterium]RTL06527.1 MAG: DUF4412 domain-containing protein [Xanthomonadales bacterium]HMV38940.1 DUF4412 domain-containing protein [Plasticicumulans sp.]HMW29371.1 DUF4412 domain-containing protein [Plasticicumulans sp.]HMW43228.1 DUF4412 domain-containing protein [Plasticicumulans sp.]